MPSRLDLYLHQGTPKYYANTPEEEARVTQFESLYQRAKTWKEQQPQANATKLDYYRRAYLAELNALNVETGKESNRKMRKLKKLVYEMIESKIDNSIPLPKMVARYKSDKYLVDTTESFIKSEIDNLMAKYVNDAAERSTYIDGTTWFKVSWNSMSNSHEHNGDVRIELRTIDQIVPQPNVKNYKDLEYIFEIIDVSLTRIYDLYGKLITPISEDSSTIKVVSCYYLNDNHIVGLFSWAEHSRQVICDEEDWQIRKLRKCKTCGAINPIENTCYNCGHKKFEYKIAEEEILDEPLIEIDNPYVEDNEEQDEGQQSIDQMQQPQIKVFAEKGTKIPFYRLRQLPFVPRPAISSLDSIYGISEVKMILDEQDASNKLLTKAFDKGMKSGTILTKPDKIKIGDKDDTIKIIPVRTSEEAQMIQAKQAVSDVSQDIILANNLYENARNTSGVTESYQGQKDTTATSGKAKQYAIAQTAGRIESLRIMKAAAFAGLYELVLKYLLAFSDEPRRFVKTLPNGEDTELTWNKYMFLAKDKHGQIYYRDDFTFNTDPAATLSQDRALMWQETQDKFINGALGNMADPRTIELYWNMMSMYDYPLAKVALAGIKANSKHLPPEIEQALMNNPELMQEVMQQLQEATDQRGGSRPNSGPAGNGATHRANVERTNDRNRSQNKDVVSSAQQSIQGGDVK